MAALTFLFAVIESLEAIEALSALDSGASQPMTTVLASRVLIKLFSAMLGEEPTERRKPLTLASSYPRPRRSPRRFTGAFYGNRKLRIYLSGPLRERGEG